MTNWINIQDQLPPIGKKIVFTADKTNMRLMTLGYAWQHDDERQFMQVATEEQIKSIPGYWFLLPEPPNE